MNRFLVALGWVLLFIGRTVIAELDTTVELGAHQLAPRSNTPLNPHRQVLDLTEQQLTTAVGLKPNWSLADFGLRGEVWGQLRYQGDGEWKQDTRGIVQDLTLYWNATPAWFIGGGLKTLHWGPSYSWNPANPFTDPESNNLDLAVIYKHSGNPYLAAEWSGEQQSLAWYGFHYKPNYRLYGPDPDILNSVGLRWQRLFSSSDLSLFLADRQGELFGSLASSATLGERLELHLEAAARSRRYTLLPQAVETPAGSFYTFTDQNRGNQVIQGLAGGQYTFANLSNVILEYSYNGEGYNSQQFRKLRRAAAASRTGLEDPVLGEAQSGFLAEANGLTGRMRRHYLFSRVTFEQLPQDLKLHFFLLYGLADNSFIPGGLLLLPLGKLVELRASYQYYGGPQNAEARLIPYRYEAELALGVNF